MDQLDGSRARAQETHPVWVAGVGKVLLGELGEESAVERVLEVLEGQGVLQDLTGYSRQSTDSVSGRGRFVYSHVGDGGSLEGSGGGDQSGQDGGGDGGLHFD